MLTIEEKKEYLKSYRMEYNKWRSLEEQKKEIIMDAVCAKGQNYDDMPKARRKTDLSDYSVRLEKVMKEIDDQISQYLAKKIRIQSAIMDLENGNERRVLVEHYLSFKSWETIGKNMDYSIREIFRIHGRALQHINL